MSDQLRQPLPATLPEPRPDHDTSSTKNGPIQQFSATTQSEAASIGDAPPATTPPARTASNHTIPGCKSSDSLWLICEDTAAGKPYYVKCSWTSAAAAGTLRLGV